MPADLNHAIRAALPFLRLALGGSVQCVAHLTAAPLPLFLDRRLFLNALLNLASNSSFAISGRGRFCITTKTDGVSIELLVEDSGRGMDEDSTGHANGGNGPGLDTVQSFADSHNANVTIDSAPGQGCRFILQMMPAGHG